MPELPEVETVKRGLTPYMKNKVIQHVIINEHKLREIIPQDFANEINSKEILSLERRAKVLIIKLSGKMNILIHLGMSGSLTYCKAGTAPLKHTHMIMMLGDIEIHFNDPRKFGFILLCSDEELPQIKYLKNLAPEPLTDEFSPEYLTKKLKNKKTNIKTAIMDNKIAVGVGNIYASEALYTAQIHPLSLCNALPQEKVADLVASIKHTLARAIDAGGSSLKDHKQADGTLGYFQHNFNVYGQENQKCNKCDNTIQKHVISNRSTFYCPNCQFLYT